MPKLIVENDWQQRATAAAIGAVRRIVADGNAIPMNTPIGRLSDVEWGWIVAAAIFGWISKRAEQAVAEGLDIETTIRTIGGDMEPWDTGMVASILPELAETAIFDWSKPLESWSREEMIRFLMTGFSLMQRAVVARDIGCRDVVEQLNDRDRTIREASAAAGGSLMTPSELNDEIPF